MQPLNALEPPSGRRCTRDEPVLEAEDLVVSFGGHRVLDGVSLRVYRGERVALAGPNGAGKTTLLRAALGIVKPTSGTVKLLGSPAGDRHALARVGYVPQRIDVPPDYPGTVEEVVRTGLRTSPGFWKIPSEQKELVRSCIEILGLTGLERKRVASLSGGLRQRVFLARALAARPELLMLDEPLSGVDVVAQKEFRSVLESLTSTGEVTLIAVVHEYGPFEGIIDRLVVIAQRMLYDGPPPLHDESGDRSHQHFDIPARLLSLTRESEVGHL